MTFARRRNRLTTHFSERIAVVKRRMTVIMFVFIPDSHLSQVLSEKTTFSKTVCDLP